MTIEFFDNEFTVWDVLEYLKAGYGVQVNGRPFTSSHVLNWIRGGKIPDAYGGNKISQAIRYKEIGNLLVLTIEGISREDIQYSLGALADYSETLNKRRKVDLADRKCLPREQRTELYFQILDRSGKLGRARAKFLPPLPTNWKEAGIRRSQ